MAGGPPLSILDSQTSQVPARSREFAPTTPNPTAFGGGLAAGLDKAGQALDNLALAARKDATDLAQFQLQKGSIDWASQEQTNLIEAQRQMSGSGAGFTKTFMEGFDQRGTDFLAQIKDPQMKAEWTARIAEQRRTFALQALNTELTQRDTYYRAETKDGLDKLQSGIEQTPDAIEAYRSQGVSAIDATGLSAGEKEALRRDWKHASAAAAMAGTVKKDPEAAYSALGGIRASKWINPDEAASYRQLEGNYGLPAGYLGGVARVESEGDGDTKSVSSTGNVGRFQFYQKDIDHWFQIGGVSRKGDVNKTDDQALATAIEGQFWARKIKETTGRDATAGELYLAHQQGGGFLKMLQNPSELAVVTAGNRAITLNGGRADMTGQQFIDLWTKKFGGGGPAVTKPWMADLTFEQRQHFQAAAAAQMQAMETATASAKADATKQFVNSLELGIHDNKVNQVDIDNARRDGRLTDFGDIAKLEELIKTRDRAKGDEKSGADALANPNFPWSTATEDHRKWVNALSKAKGYDVEYDAGLWEKTGIMPERFSERLLSEARSGDLQKTIRAASIAEAALRTRPGAFAGVANQKELEDLGAFWGQQRTVAKAPPAEAAQAWIDQHNPLKPVQPVTPAQVDTFKAKMHGATGGAEDFVRSAWDDPSVWFFQDWDIRRTKAAYDALPVAQKAPIMATFREAAADAYARTGDEKKAIEEAQRRVRDNYGVSNFASGLALGGQRPTAEGRVLDPEQETERRKNTHWYDPTSWELRPRSSTFFTPFPAEHAYGEAVKGYGTDWLYKAAAAEASKVAGAPIEPKDVQLRPVPQTRDAFLNRGVPGAPPVPYQVWFTAPSGATHMIGLPMTFDGAKKAEQDRIAKANQESFWSASALVDKALAAEAERIKQSTAGGIMTPPGL